MTFRTPPVQWKPGQSGNPSGRPKGMRELEELARSHAPDAIKHIVKLMNGEAYTFSRRGLRVPIPVAPHTQLAAAIALIERGYGKSVQPIKSEGDGPVHLQRIERVIVQLDGSDEALRILDAEPVLNGHGHTNGHYARQAAEIAAASKQNEARSATRRLP